jgi:hypothetical protein
MFLPLLSLGFFTLKLSIQCVGIADARLIMHVYPALARLADYE